MIQINLLPVKARKRKENVRQFVSVYFLSVFLLLVAIAYLWISRDTDIRGLERRLAQVKSEVSQYAKYDVMLKELKEKKEIMVKKRTVIKELQQDRDKIVRIMALLSIQVPADKLWFEKLSESGNSMTLNGVALSNEAVAEFMKNLESSPYIEKGSVNLQHSRQVVMSEMKLREFQLNYRFFPFSTVQEMVKTDKSVPKSGS